MEIRNYIKQGKELYSLLYNFIKGEDDTIDYNELISLIKTQYLHQNKKEFSRFLHILSKIAENHNRQSDFLNKLEQIFLTFEKDIKNFFSNIEIFNCFKKSRHILLILFDKQIITADISIVSSIYNDKDINSDIYLRFLLPEIELFIPENVKNGYLEDLDLSDDLKYEKFKKLRKPCQNESYISTLIRDDSIIEFIKYTNQTNLPLTTQIRPTIFETNAFLIDQSQSSLIEYAAFFGSIQIFQYLRMNNVEMKPSLWFYAIHGNNPEIIHCLEENNIKPSDLSYKKCIKESIKCHHNEIAKYLIDNFAPSLIKFTNEVSIENLYQSDQLSKLYLQIESNFASFCFHYYNFEFWPDDIVNDIDFIYYYLIEYENIELVNLLLKYLTEIGSSSFDSCDYITKLDIPSCVKSIGNLAFHKCTSLIQVSIPSSVTSIGDGAFEGCSSLTQIVIPSSVTSIASNIFKGCKSLTQITFSSDITFIGEAAFEGCSSLTQFTIPSSVTSIARQTFKDCKSLTQIEFSSSVTSIGAGAFEGCSSLTQFTLPSSVTSIARQTFKDCKSLTQIEFSSSVTSIGDGAFEGCSSLVQIELPPLLFHLGVSSFEGCSSLTQINIPSILTSILSRTFKDCSSLTQITILSELASIGASSFEGCSSLTRIALPSSLKLIGKNPFKGCSSLTQLEIPYNSIPFRDEVFDGCTLNEIIIKTLPFDALECCKSLVVITIPRSSKVIHSFSFENLNNLTSISIPNIDIIEENAFKGCKSLKIIENSDMVIRIGDNAFADCILLKEVTLPSIVKIGKYAFSGCSQLEKVNLSDFPKFIGRFAFRNCKSLKSLSIPNTLKTYGKNIFFGCDSLTQLKIPTSVDTSKLGINSTVNIIRVDK